MIIRSALLETLLEPERRFEIADAVSISCLVKYEGLVFARSLAAPKKLCSIPHIRFAVAFPGVGRFRVSAINGQIEPQRPYERDSGAVSFSR